MKKKENWVVDAANFVEFSEFDKEFEDNCVIYTPEISRFIESKNGRILLATKGLGKTLLLAVKMKHMKTTKEGFHFLPSNKIRDTINFFPELCDKAYDHFSEIENWEILWKFSIIQGVLSQEFVQKHLASRQVKLRVTQEGFNISNFTYNYVNMTSCFYFVYNLRMIFKQYLNNLNRFSDYASVLFNKVNIPIATFIDNIDECFDSRIKTLSFKDDFTSSMNISSNNFWYYSQGGLMLAIHDLIKENKKIKIFASLRVEAYSKLAKKELQSFQMRDLTVELKYNKEELKDIFVQNVMLERMNKLAIPDLLETNPIKSFIGYNEAENEKGMKEDVFDFILRHTLYRPRDLIFIGQTFSARGFNDTRNIEDIVSIVEEAGSVIVDEYFKEAMPHLYLPRLVGEHRNDIADIPGINDEFIRILSITINSDIFELDAINNICLEFNVEFFGQLEDVCRYKEEGNCFKCSNFHLFCNLYKIGLLGYVHRPHKLAKTIQKFVLYGSKLLGNIYDLPISKYYFLHPILNEKIRSRNPNFKAVENVIVGHGCEVDEDLLENVFNK